MKKLLKTISDSNLDWKEKQYSGGDVKKKKRKCSIFLLQKTKLVAPDKPNITE